VGKNRKQAMKSKKKTNQIFWQRQKKAKKEEN